MSKVTTLALLVAVAALAVFVWLQTEREDPDFGRVEFPLLEGLDPRRIASVRYESLERGTQVGLRRDGGGRWFLTDPIAYPARQEMVTQLLQAFSNVAYAVPREELELAERGLSPPRAVLEVVERLDGDARREHVLEMGSVDLDAMRVYVRTRGRIFRTMRNLETPLEAPVEDWRSRRVFGLEGAGIVEIRREGFDYVGERQVPLAVSAQRQGPSWWIDHPVRLHADPVAMTTWGQILSVLTIERYLSDVEEPDLAAWGLDAPWFSLTLTDRKGVSQTAHFSGEVGTYVAKRDDLPYVWQIAPRDVQRLLHDPLELFDETLVRVFRRDVDSILLAGPEHTVRLTQDRREQDWTVAWKERGMDEWSMEQPANEAAVDRVLSTMEQSQLAGYRWDDPVEQHFPADAPDHGVWVESDGIRHGGRIGPVLTSEEGTRLVAYLRDRENRVALAPLAVGELLEIPPLDFVSLGILVAVEPELHLLEIGERRFLRDVQGLWVYEDVHTEAKELHPVLDHVFHMFAERHVARDEMEELVDPVRVRVHSRRGQVHEVEVGRTEEGEVRVQKGGRQSVLRHPEVHGMLVEIAGRKPG